MGRGRGIGMGGGRGVGGIFSAAPGQESAEQEVDQEDRKENDVSSLRAD